MTWLLGWLLLFFGSLVVIGIIMLRHFMELAVFDASSVARIQEKNVKQNLATRRVFRWFHMVWEKCGVVVRPMSNAWVALQNSFRTRANKIADQYRHLEWKQKWQAWRGRSRGERRAFLLTALSSADELRRVEQYVDAEKKYVEIISLDPKQVNAYVGLGKTYFRQERWKESEETFRHVVSNLDSIHELAWAFLGRALKEQGLWDVARDAFEHALKLDETLVKRWLDLGDCFRKLEKNSEAVNAYKKAAQLEPNNPRVLDQLIEIGIVSDDKHLAQEAFAGLQAVNPENQKLVEWEERIAKM